MIIQAKLFTSNYTVIMAIELCLSLQPCYKVSFMYVMANLYFLS